MGDAIPTGPTTVLEGEPGLNETTIVEGQEADQAQAGAQEESDIGNSESWVPEGASDEFKALVEKHDYKSADDVAQALAALETKLGSSVQIPGKDASDDEIDAFFKRLGRPENSGGYELPEPELPDGFDQDKQFSEAYRKMAFDSGLSGQQARMLWDWYNSRTVAMFTNKRQTDIRDISNAFESLREGWGENFDNELAITKTLVGKHGDEELIKLFNSTGLGNNPYMIRFVNKLAHALGEDRLDGSGGGRPVPKSTKREGVLDYDNLPNPTGKQ